MTTPLQAYRQAIITTRRQPNRRSGERNYGSARINHLLISDVGLGFLFSELTHTQLTDFDIEDLYNYSFAPEYHTFGRRTFYQLRSRYNSRSSAGRQNVNWSVVDRRPRNRTVEDVQRRADILNRILAAARALSIRIDPADRPGNADGSAGTEDDTDDSALEDNGMDVDQTTNNSDNAEQDSLLDADGQTDDEYAHEDEDMVDAPSRDESQDVNASPVSNANRRQQDNQTSIRNNHSLRSRQLVINEDDAGLRTQHSAFARPNMTSQLNPGGRLQQSNNAQPGQLQNVPPYPNTRLHIEQFRYHQRVAHITGDLYPGRDQHDPMILQRFHDANAQFVPRRVWELAQTQQDPDQARSNLPVVPRSTPRPSNNPNTLGLRQAALLHTREPLEQDALAGLMYLDQLIQEEDEDDVSVPPSPPSPPPPPRHSGTINPALLSIPEREYWPRGQYQTYGMTFGQAVLAVLYCYPWLLPEQAIQLLRDANGDMNRVVPRLAAISDPVSPWSHGVWDEALAYAIIPTLLWYLPAELPAGRGL